MATWVIWPIAEMAQVAQKVAAPDADETGTRQSETACTDDSKWTFRLGWHRRATATSQAATLPRASAPLVDSELEALEVRIDARLRRLVIADRLRSIGVRVAVTGALVLGLVLV